MLYKSLTEFYNCVNLHPVHSVALNLFYFMILNDELKSKLTQEVNEKLQEKMPELENGASDFKFEEYQDEDGMPIVCIYFSVDGKKYKMSYEDDELDDELYSIVSGEMSDETESENDEAEDDEADEAEKSSEPEVQPAEKAEDDKGASSESSTTSPDESNADATDEAEKADSAEKANTSVEDRLTAMEKAVEEMKGYMQSLVKNKAVDPESTDQSGDGMEQPSDDPKESSDETEADNAKEKSIDPSNPFSYGINPLGGWREIL